MGKMQFHPPLRLRGFDYRTPYFYMVTIHAVADLHDAFSAIGPQGCIKNAITDAFLHAIRMLHLAFPEIEPVSCFTIMPDHLHLLIRILPGEGSRHSLIEIVESLKETLAQHYFRASGTPLPPAQKGWANFLQLAPRVFQTGFHDHIVKMQGQLARFRRYIRTNPQRAWLRRQARAQGFFNRVRRVQFAGRTWYAYGNVALLEQPQIVPLKGHRATREGSFEWQALVDAASRLGPGSAGVSTFMSPLERACGRAIGLAGGSWIVLSPRGFPSSGDGSRYDSPEGEPTRWHPSEAHEKWCACGRMLYLSLWERDARTLDNVELGRRSHAMGDAVAGV